MKPQSVLVTATLFTSTRPVGLKTGIHFPKHARPAGRPIKLRSPLPAEAKLVQPMSRRNRGNENAEGQQRSGPGFLVEQAAGKPENVDGEFGVCAVLAMDNAPTRAQALKIFFHGAGPRDLSVRESDTGKRVGIAASGADPAEGLGQGFRVVIGLGAHLAIANFEGRSVRSEPVEIFLRTAAGQARENVIHRKEKSALGEIHDERDKIVPTALNLGMVFLGDVIDAEVHLRAAGHADGDFLAEKEI